MPTPIDAIDAAIREADVLLKTLKKNKQPQVRSSDDQLQAKGTALAWFQNHRFSIASLLGDFSLADIDAGYKIILESSARHAGRSTYLSALSDVRKRLVIARSECAAAPPQGRSTSDNPPDFLPLIADPDMQRILIARWNECVLCLNAKAALAATVMMGGLLEALLLARINRENDKSPIFKAKTAPKISKTGQTKPLNEWMLNDFIQVLAEIKWITVATGSVGGVLREYRNYVHPQKQLSHNMHLTPEDAALFWEISKNIARQIIASVGR